MNRLHPATMIVAFLPKLYEAFRSVLPFLAISFFSGGGDNTEFFIAAIGALGGFGAIVAYMTTRYGIQDGQLVCASGWLFKRDRRIPLSKIQNVNIRQGVLERMLKVATVEVETAAGSGAELKLQVVTEQTAEELRRELSALAVSSVEPRAHAQPATESDVIYRMNTNDLILGAMTENQGGQVLFALIGTLGAAAITQLANRFAQFTELVPGWMLGSVAVVITLFVMGAGWIYGGVQYAIKNAFFTVRGEPGLFRITHGLFTKVQYAVRLKRVEMAVVSSTVWQRLVKCCTIRVGTGGSFGEEGATAPIAMMLPQDRMASTLKSVLPQFDSSDLDWKPLPRYYMRVSIVRSLLWLTVLGAIAAIFLRAGAASLAPQLRVAIPTVLTGICIWIWIDLVISYKRAGYAISNGMLAVRSGFFRQTMTLMPIARVDTVGTSEPSWWRTKGVTTFIANAMVHKLQIAMLPEAEAERVRSLIVARPSQS